MMMILILIVVQSCNFLVAGFNLAMCSAVRCLPVTKHDCITACNRHGVRHMQYFGVMAVTVLATDHACLNTM